MTTHTPFTCRPYDTTRDHDAAARIWVECGWIEADAEGRDEVTRWAERGHAWVAEVDGDAECMVLGGGAILRYQQTDVRTGIIGAVTTSRVARRQGIARRLTAHVTAELVAAGARVTSLGMFEQGFYNRLGFGTGVEDTFVDLDPRRLLVPTPKRRPVRLGVADVAEVHACRTRRRRGHGAMTADAVEDTHGTMWEADNGFGLGYRAPDGRLTHCVWLGSKDVENGPYICYFQAYETHAQLLELLGLLKSLGDQIYRIRIYEPPGVQLQALLPSPTRSRAVTRGGKYEHRATSLAWHQHRINDVAACVAACRLPNASLAFNLTLADPISAYLPTTAAWRGVAGDYTVRLGSVSTATMGHTPGLPTLNATCGAFTRLWLGVRPASGLAVTDRLTGPDALLAELDHSLVLPVPRPDWDF